MKMVSVQVPYNTFCKGCKKRLFLGEEAYREFNASFNADTYCSPCAIGMVYQDPTRSETVYYSSTR